MNEYERFTGCHEASSGIGKGFDEKENIIENLKGVSSAEFPNAGSQSYEEVFGLMGYPYVTALQTCSSAGDWDFLISKDKKEWRIASQMNRYPYFGFKYLIGQAVVSSKKKLSGDEAVEIYCCMEERQGRMNKFFGIIEDATREELEEFMAILEEEIRLSDLAIEEGLEEVDCVSKF